MKHCLWSLNESHLRYLCFRACSEFLAQFKRQMKFQLLCFQSDSRCKKMAGCQWFIHLHWYFYFLARQFTALLRRRSFESCRHLWLESNRWKYQMNSTHILILYWMDEKYVVNALIYHLLYWCYRVMCCYCCNNGLMESQRSASNKMYHHYLRVFF